VSSAVEPTEEERAAAATLLRMIWGLHISRAVYLAAELGLADLLARGEQTAAALAEATQTVSRPCTGCCACWPRSAC
jgi:hypothetical protein